jgi:hypothetical protein
LLQALIGGTAGVVGTLLYRSTEGAMAVGIYLSFLALICALCIRFHLSRLDAANGTNGTYFRMSELVSGRT